MAGKREVRGLGLMAVVGAIIIKLTMRILHNQWVQTQITCHLSTEAITDVEHRANTEIVESKITPKSSSTK